MKATIEKLYNEARRLAMLARLEFKDLPEDAPPSAGWLKARRYYKAAEKLERLERKRNAHLNTE